MIANSLEKLSISEEQKATLLSRASDSSNEARNNIKNLDGVCSKGVSELDKAFNSLKLELSFAQVDMNLVKAGVKTAKNMAPPITATALWSAALTAKHATSSQTLGESLNTAMDDFSRLEVLVSVFISIYLNKLKNF